MENTSNERHLPIHIDNLNRLNLIYNLTYSDGEYYQSFQYDKHMLCYNDEARGMHRHTWLSYPDNVLLSVTIPKSQPYYLFQFKYPIMNEDIMVMEHIEGELLSLYYDKRINKWKITMDVNQQDPHTVLSTFYELFNITMAQTLNDIAMLEYLPKDHSYTFLLKIPSMALYINNQEPELYLISVYKIQDATSVYISQNEYENWCIFKDVNNSIKMPKYYDFDTYKQLSEKEILQSYGSSISGMVVKHRITGEFCKILTEHYKNHKSLMDIEPLVRYKYLCILRTGKIGEYINTFPSIKNDFLKMNDIYNQFMNRVYYAYNNKYKYKQDNLYDLKYYAVIRKIHQQYYMSQSRVNSIAINRNTIKKYMNQCDPKQIYYLLHCTV